MAACAAGWSGGNVTHVLFEREAERLAILATLDQVASGGVGAAMLLRGEPGVGKTRLLQLAEGEAATRFTLVRASGHEMEQAYPLALVHQILESLLHSAGPFAGDLARASESLRRLLRTSVHDPQARGNAGAPARSEMLYALYWLLSSLAERRPVLLSLDDLHWSDPDSLEAVRFLVWRCRNAPIAAIAAMRPWPRAAGEIAERLRAGARASLMEVKPLSVEATGSLLQSVAGHLADGERVARTHEMTGGNPFLVEQVGRILDSGGPMPEGDALPSTSRCGYSVILSRLAGLPKSALSFLQAASVLGVSWRQELALALAGVRAEEAPQVLAAPLGLGLVALRGEGAAGFVHPLVRRAIYESVDPDGRDRLHLRAADLLRERGARATEVAPHIAAAASPGDPVALRELRQAAEEAWAVSAYDSAAIHLRHAVRLTHRGPEKAGALYDLGRAYQRAGSYRMACDTFEAAVQEDCETDLLCRIHQSWGFSLTLCGDADAAIGHFGQAIAAAEDAHPALAAEVASAKTILEVTTRGMADAGGSAGEALRLANRSGAPAALAKARGAWSQVAFLSGDHLEARRFAQEANAPLSGEEPDEMEQIWGWCPRIQLGMIDMRTERYEEALAVMQRQWGQAEARHMVPARIWATTFLAEIEWRRGRLREAYRWCADSALYPEGIPWATAQAYAIHAYVLMDMGDLAHAESCFTRAEEDSRRAALGATRLTCAWGRATLAARRGAIDAAAAAFRELMESADRIRLADRDFFRAGREAAEVFVRIAAYAEAQRVIDGMLDQAGESDRPGWRAAALRCLGLLEARRGSGLAAERAMLAALALHAQADEALERGRTLLAYGSILRRAGEPKRARPVLGEAARVFEHCGGGYWQQMAETERGSAGGRRRAHGPGVHIDLLTPQEYRIVELVVQGCSNRQIAYHLLISPKTLETHLRHVYEKLEVPSRDELKRFFLEHAPPAR